MEGGAQSSFDNNKKAALVSLFALGSVLVSYMVYQRVADTESSERRRKHERMVRKARRQKARLSQQSRIVGANQQFQLGMDDDRLTQDEREQLNYERMEQDLVNAATGTKTIYFDGNDNMYTEEEVLGGTVNKKQRTLTKMKVRVPEKDRKKLSDVKNRQTHECLNDFISQIKQTKSNYVKQRYGMTAAGSQGKARSQKFRAGLGSEMTTSSGTVRSLNRIKLEPRHFKSKEGTVWLNMFETISNNYCLGDTSSQGLKNRMDPLRFAIPTSSNDKARSSKHRVMPRNSSLQNLPVRDQQQYQQQNGGGYPRMSRADLYAQEQLQEQQQRKRITRSTSQEMLNMSNFE